MGATCCFHVEISNFVMSIRWHIILLLEPISTIYSIRNCSRIMTKTYIMKSSCVLQLHSAPFFPLDFYCLGWKLRCMTFVMNHGINGIKIVDISKIECIRVFMKKILKKSYWIALTNYQYS